MVRTIACLFCAAFTTLPAFAAKAPAVTLEDILFAVQEQWGEVRDMTVQDRVTRIDYRQMGPLPLPKSDKVRLSTHPNRWMIGPGLEYLELWQGDKYVKVAYYGDLTQWEGQRNAFGPYLGRVCKGNNVPNADLTFSYYLGRFGQYAGIVHFLESPDTRLVKANKRVDDIICHRVRGLVQMDIDGTVKPYDVTIDLAPDYGWLPLRAEFVDAATGETSRVYRVRSFFNKDTFPFPKEAQIDFYELRPSTNPNGSPHAVLTSSLSCHVESVEVNRGLKPSDFIFDFAPGTEVRDERTGEVFVVPQEEAPAE